MQLNNRLQILKDSCQISCENYQDMLKVIEMFKEKFGIELTEENGSMFITHLAIAYDRVNKNEHIEATLDIIDEEIKNNKNYDKSEEIFMELQNQLDKSLPDNEKTFILMHLCVLLDK